VKPKLKSFYVNLGRKNKFLKDLKARLKIHNINITTNRNKTKKKFRLLSKLTKPKPIDFKKGYIKRRKTRSNENSFR